MKLLQNWDNLIKGDEGDRKREKISKFSKRVRKLVIRINNSFVSLNKIFVHPLRRENIVFPIIVYDETF